MAADGLAPIVARTSAAMLFTINEFLLLIFFNMYLIIFTFSIIL